MTIEIIQLLLAGFCIALQTIPKYVLISLNLWSAISPYLTLVRFIFWAAYLTLPMIIWWIHKKTKLVKQVERINLKLFYLGSVTAVIGWLSFGYSFWLLGTALFPITPDQVTLFMFTISSSILIGLAIIIVPASIGVRESVMVWILGPVIGAPQAVIVAALARLIVTLSEIVSAYGFKLLHLPGITRKY
jgi:hypothetical protein